MKGRIMIVDDEVNILKSLTGILSDEGYDVETAQTGEDALLKLEGGDFDAILLDIWLPGIDGIRVLKEALEIHPGIPVIMISGHGTIETAVEAVKRGAFDFLEKPLSMDRVILKIENALYGKKVLKTKEEYRHRPRALPYMVGFTGVMKDLKGRIETAAPTDTAVLIQGENGTGKELVARMIHDKSGRRGGPFVPVNCAAIPEGLIESELFGHVKGAFTGAVRTRPGKAEQASGGTLFLDEIGDMSPPMQAKLLRFLESKEVEKVGGSENVAVDVRIICATHRNLLRSIREGEFREDLYFRINVIPLFVPPLRERKEDISYLAEHFLKVVAVRSGKIGKTFSPGAQEFLIKYLWPGNVRELKNIVERLFILSEGEIIGEEDVKAALGFKDPMEGPKTDGYLDSYRESFMDFERDFLLSKLRENGMNISRTALKIGLDRSSIHRKLKSLGIQIGTADENNRE